jgi:hypothetical protein
VNNGGAHAEASATGSVAISGQTCANSIYWATFEYFSALGGDSVAEYSWQPPGASALEPVTQDVLWGEVTRHGVPVAGDSITITGGSVATTVVSDAGGCYGFNLPPAAHSQKLSLALVDGGNTYYHGAGVSNGTVSRLDLKVP